MKEKFFSFILLVLICVSLSACSIRFADVKILEDLTLALAIALDIEGDEYVIYQSSPVFHPEAEEAVEILSTHAISFTQSRKGITTMSSGYLASGKLQVVLLGRELLQEGDIISHLDLMFRDPIFPANVKVVAVDGSVKEVMYFDREDKPRLAIYLKELHESSFLDEATVETTLQQFFRQVHDKGVTPAISKIEKGDQELKFLGTTLLNNDGSYVTCIDNNETVHLLMIKDNLVLPAEVTYPTPEVITIRFNDIRRSVQTDFQDGVFIFDVAIDARAAVIRELTVPPDVENGNDERNIREKNLRDLEKILAQQMKEQCEQLVKKAQQHKVDPFGLGIYARGQRYNYWKEVQDDWPAEFSNAVVNIDTKVKIKEYGVIRN